MLHISQAPQTDRKAFLEWWTGEKERAVRDRVALVVVVSSYKYACHKEWLQTIEEEEWFDNDDGLMRVRFMTLANCNNSLTDGWGDIIKKVSKDSAGAIAQDDEQHLADVGPMAVAINDGEEDSGEGSVVDASIQLMS